MSEEIGYVLGTQEATPLQFWVAVKDGSVLRLDDVVSVTTDRPDGRGNVRFYGVIDYVRTLHEGAEFDTDTFLAKSGNIPVAVSYAAHVQVTRLDPEEYLPPQPGDAVQRAIADDLKQALHFDSMDTRIPAGLMRNGEAAYFNYAFVNGDKGAHVNISGISGVATKTSYALFLLHAILNSPATGSPNQKKALIFNVKGQDLFFLDKANSKRDRYERKLSRNGDRLQTLGLPIEPFRNVKFCAPPRKGTKQLVGTIDQRTDGAVVPYLWSVREICHDRLFRFLFVGEELERGNLVYLLGSVEENLAKLAKNSDRKASYLEVPDGYGEHGKFRVTCFEELIELLEDRLIESEEWLARNTPSTGLALIRRLWGVRDEVSHLIRGDMSLEELAKYRLDPLGRDRMLTVADINSLGAKAQMFVVGVVLRRLFSEKEKLGKDPTIFVVLDELNKYAPREGRSPIKELLVEIAERGRSLGIILIGAQQTASEVERRVVGQAAVRVVGRLDAAEANRPEYSYLSQSSRQRVLFMKSGTMVVQQPEVPAPILVEFPFPPYATRKAEVADAIATDAKAEADFYDDLGI